jgi:spoIIIJ-associated protein
MPAALPQLEETMTDQTVSDEATEVDSDAEVAETETETETETDAENETKPSGADTLENEGEIAADYLEELLDIADLDGDIDTYVEGGRAHVSIVTEGDLLVGADGAVLEALQELARMAVMTETGRRSRLMLDIAGHRDRRRKELEVLAKDAIADVKESGEPVRLAPMNPFERKIVHDVVAAAGLVSESEGEEPRRCVVVRPA